MSEAIIAGLGIQGAAIAYGMSALGYEVVGVDISPATVSASTEFLHKLGVPITATTGNAFSFIAGIQPPQSCDVLVSALPFRFNTDLAGLCIERGIRYCDLGGNIDTSNRIRELAQNRVRAPVMTDLGLAPGIANIIAELGFRKLEQADTVRIRVGGLPVNPRGTLRYGLTFSPQGLFNEYHDKCLVIRNGKIRAVDPLCEIEHIHFEGLGELEAFTTSGGIAGTLETMLARGVKECDYKTIRFPGHADLVRFMLFECGMDRDSFSEAVTNACGFITEDQVLIDIDVSDSTKQTSWTKRARILHDDDFTAMQKTTGFGAAAVAAILGSGKMDGKPYLLYADVPAYEFIENMSALIPELALS